MDKRRIAAGLLAAGMISLTAYAAEQSALSAQPKAPTAYTIEKNQKMYELLDFSDQQETEFAKKGFLAAPEELVIQAADGKTVWSQADFDFLSGSAPDTANPSLWRNAQLNHLYGLFEVTQGIYQVRGYDMSNITFIEGEKGWIVFDPLMSVECAEAALALANETLGAREVTAVVLSHPHVDHYGGIKGVIRADSGVPIIVPEGFEESAVNENVFAGNAMGRRASYQYGPLLETGAQGALSIGIGLGQSKGTISYLPPTDHITKTGETRTLDGVEMVFQLTPGTEAPAEMNIWLPEKKALWLAENCTATMHNLYTLRGAQVRDGNAWAEYIMEAAAMFGEEAEVAFQSHNWPHWGNRVIINFMENTAAVYKFINDQTLMYINQGYTSNEIAHMIRLPEALEKVWYTRQYYGTIEHNSKAVYQRYMGWYDANPVHLGQLAPTESAKKFVEYMGDPARVLELAQADYAKGEYQWVAEITNILVFADSQNLQARYLCADAMEQMAYSAESGPWRNAYLTGAKELREGITKDDTQRAKSNVDTKRAMSPEMIFNYMGILLDSNAAQDLNMKLNFNITDDEPYLITVKSGVLLWQKGAEKNADATISLPRLSLLSLLNSDEAALEAIKVEGNADALKKLTAHMNGFEYFFPIVEP